MKILVTGVSGLIGSALIPSLKSGGHVCLQLVRQQSQVNDSNVFWNPNDGEIDAASLNGLDAIVHLAGENVSEGRWTDEKKQRIRESRVKGTTLISETIASLTPRPHVLVSASATGFYGNRGAEMLTEASASGDDFLASVSREWELATRAAAAAGVRVVNLRFGVVLDKEGGALAKMLTPFRLGMGGRLGDGKQFMSWIALDDVVGVINHALEDEKMSGAVNVVSPSPVTNEEFTKALGSALSRPTIFPAPAFALRLAFGEMADALLLSSARVEPAKLLSAGYKFQYPDLDNALRHILK
jgi:uncharacterized protein (TIGR01777 family)